MSDPVDPNLNRSGQNPSRSSQSPDPRPDDAAKVDPQALGDNLRGVAIPSELRGVAIPSELRGVAIPSELRGVAMPNEPAGPAQSNRAQANRAADGCSPGLRARLQEVRKALILGHDAPMGATDACYNHAPAAANARARGGDSMKLQACPKCEAQFDVSAYDAGQQFTCGSCGHVMTAHDSSTSGAPAGRKPGARKPAAGKPAAGGAARTPGARKSAAGSSRAPAGKKGPQYQPPSRVGDGGSKSAGGAAKSGVRTTTAKRASGAARSSARAPREPVEAAGPNKALIGGILAVVAVGVIALLVLGGDKDNPSANPNGNGNGMVADNDGNSGANTPVIPSETATEVMGEYGTNPPSTNKDWRSFIGRLKSVGDEPSKIALKRVYKDYIETLDGTDNKEARAALGFREFDYEIPRDIANRNFDYMRGVKAAKKLRWFGPQDDEEWKSAVTAKAKTEDHYKRLLDETDNEFQAGVDIRGNIANMKHYKDLNYEGYWASPYLVIYSSAERVSELDLLEIEDRKEREAKRKDLRERRRKFTSLLKEKATILQGLYKEWMKRFAEPLNLKPLMDRYGGRDDYGAGVKSYANGCPMMMWIFDNRESFQKFHKDIDVNLPQFAAGYFKPVARDGTEGWIFLYDEGGSDNGREFEIIKTVHEGTHQLEFWFTRQRNNWRHPPNSQDFFSEGLAEWLGSAQLQKDGSLKFVGVNTVRVRGMKNYADQLKAQGQDEYPVFPLEKMTAFFTYGHAAQYAAETWKLDSGISLLYQQSWAFMYFMNTYDGGRYKKKMMKLFDLVLHGEGGRPSEETLGLHHAFKEAFRIRGEEDWEDLNDEFQEFVKGILKMDLKPYEYTPPSRED